MRVFITGATTVLGRALVPELLKHGHDVVGLARNDASRAMLHAMRVSAFSSQGRDADHLAEALDSVHAIVHLATALPTRDSPVEDEWATSGTVIVGLMRTLLTASERSSVRTVVLPSFYGVYGNHGEEWVDEMTALDPDPTSKPFAEAEYLLLRATERRTSAGVVLRIGMLYAADAVHTRGLLYGLQRGQAPLIGDGRMFWPQIHAEDAAQAIRLALEKSPVGQILNVCDDMPVRQGQLYTDLASWLGGPPPPPRAGTGELKPYLGQVNLEPLRFSVRMRNDKIKQTLGFVPQYPTYREGYKAIIAGMQQTA
jgi:nucleoside-diphosphate-sugar epimerase